jgi:hypothetical protein
MADRHDDLAGMARDKALHRHRQSALQLNEGLAAWKAKPGRVPLNRLPLGQLGEILQLFACPLTEVTLEKASLDRHLEPEPRSDRLGRLPSSLEGRGVYRSHGTHDAKPLRDRNRLLLALFRQVKPRGATR